jgi:hypothetical protein
LTYRGIPIIADEKCPTYYLFTININTWIMPVFKKMVDANPVKVASTKIE